MTTVGQHLGPHVHMAISHSSPCSPGGHTTRQGSVPPPVVSVCKPE